MNGRHGDWCERLAAAVADGRYLENPDVWRDHLEGCPSCRELAEGLTVLHARIQRTALEVHQRSAPTESAEVLIAEAFRRYRRGRRIKGLSLGVFVLLGFALGFAFLRGGGDPTEEPDAGAYAARLHEQVFGRSSPDYDLLKRDEALQREYLAALDHESSLVRRVARQALMYSGIELSTERLAEVLSTSDENLEVPLTVAAVGDGTRHLEDALALRRDRTIAAALAGAFVQAARGGERLEAALVEPYVDHPVAAVRGVALRALAADPTYRPTERIVRRMRLDEDDDVRKAAAMLLVERGGDADVEIVVRYLRDAGDWTTEGHLLPVLGTHPEMLALAGERIVDPDVPPGLALYHLRLLARANDDVEVPAELVERALAAADPTTWSVLAWVARERDLVGARTPLQACWQRCPAGPARSSLATHLVRWDLGCCAEDRLCLALDILEADRDERLRDQVVTLAGSDLPSVRDRAQNLLSRWPARN